MHVLHRQEEGLAEDSVFTCRTCKNNFSDKNEMMIHRKIEHIDEVKDCKDIETKKTVEKAHVIAGIAMTGSKPIQIQGPQQIIPQGLHLTHSRIFPIFPPLHTRMWWDK